MTTPSISNVTVDNATTLSCTVKGIDVCFANALRRTILSDIPTVVFYTEVYADNQCTILVNTSQHINEILKQRLSCIPIHSTDLKLLPGNYILEVNVQNDTDNIIYITTEDFQIIPKEGKAPLSKEDVRKIFPKNELTNAYIDFARLRPRISDEIPGAHIHLRCEFSVSTARQSSTFNVVSKCACVNTPDMDKAMAAWDIIETKYRADGLKADEIEFHKTNYMLLDAQRHFKPNSFDFTIETVGVFTNTDIMKKACMILQNKIVDLISALQNDKVTITISKNTMDHCFDLELNEDYSIGNILNYLIYEKYYVLEKTINYTAFKFMHPHDDAGVLRIGFLPSDDKMKVNDKMKVIDYVQNACIDAEKVLSEMFKMF